MIKVSKNNVSYFEAGFKAAMVLFGNIPEAEVKRRFYATTLYPILMRKCLELYDSKEDDTSGSEYMLNNL